MATSSKNSSPDQLQLSPTSDFYNTLDVDKGDTYTSNLRPNRTKTAFVHNRCRSSSISTDGAPRLAGRFSPRPTGPLDPRLTLFGQRQGLAPLPLPKPLLPTPPRLPYPLTSPFAVAAAQAPFPGPVGYLPPSPFVTPTYNKAYSTGFVFDQPPPKKELTGRQRLARAQKYLRQAQRKVERLQKKGVILTNSDQEVSI